MCFFCACMPNFNRIAEEADALYEQALKEGDSSRLALNNEEKTDRLEDDRKVHERFFYHSALEIQKDLDNEVDYSKQPNEDGSQIDHSNLKNKDFDSSLVLNNHEGSSLSLLSNINMKNNL